MRENIIELMAKLKNQLEIEISSDLDKEVFEPLQVNEMASFGKMLNEKRKALQLDIQSLEWQTGISSSTLKRLFKDPSQVKFSSVVLVAQTLGVKLCFAK
ncbi:transcriptional regulator [Ursidibacter arcticus]|uniref:transcriptional regulator n=1 Tax=Ursidibacter arcticus TaxID=1524965 RepID=UPI001F075405|nr:transcriptional regulator [Ursidibacter arcticus]